MELRSSVVYGFRLHVGQEFVSGISMNGHRSEQCGRWHEGHFERQIAEGDTDAVEASEATDQAVLQDVQNRKQIQHRTHMMSVRRGR